MALFSLSTQLQKLPPSPWILPFGTPELNNRAGSNCLDLSHLDINELKTTEQQIIEAISHTKVLRNLKSPLNNLPTEILANVFSFLQAPIRSYTPFPLPSNPLRDCIHASHVCRHWRRTALSTPSLWDHVFFDDGLAEAPLQFSRRSRGIPSKIFCTAPLPPESQEEADFQLTALDEILRDSSQLGEFHVCTPWVRNSPFWDTLKRPAPLLESISFEMDGYTSDDTVTILPPIFNDEMPSLKSVYLSNISAWPYNHFRNLVRFILYDQPRDSRPSLPGFLAFLADSSATLEELVMVRAGPTHYEMPPGMITFKSTRTIALPSLRYLEIGDSDPWIAKGDHLRSFLAHIIIPPTTKRCFWESSQELSVSDYFPRCEGQGSGIPEIKRVVLTSYETSSGQTCMVGFNASTLYLNFRWDGGPQFVLRSREGLFDKVEELVYSPSNTWSIQIDQEILECLPALRTIQFSGALWSKPRRRLLSYLEEIERNESEPDVPPTFKYAPHLEALHVYSEGAFSGTQVEVLNRVGSIRRSEGRPVRTLVVDRFLEDDVERLQDHFENAIPVDSGEGDELGLSRDDILSQFWVWYGIYRDLWQ